jgi:alpha-glucosidase
VWDETKVINGEIGKFATVARRSGDDWFVGTVNDHEPRQLQLPLTFLPAGRPYIAHTYSDDKAVPTKTHVAVATQRVDLMTTLEIPLVAAGGLAVWLTPAVPNK